MGDVGKKKKIDASLIEKTCGKAIPESLLGNGFRTRHHDLETTSQTQMLTRQPKLEHRLSEMNIKDINPQDFLPFKISL